MVIVNKSHGLHFLGGFVHHLSVRRLNIFTNQRRKEETGIKNGDLFAMLPGYQVI